MARFRQKISVRPIEGALFQLLMWTVLVVVLEATSYLGGALLEKTSASIEMKRKSEIFQDQKEKILSKFRAGSNDTFDSHLGWTYKPNLRSQLYNNNSAGLRGTTEYGLARQDNVIRIAAFGDSFVYGNEVADQDTWTYELENLLPNTEVLNFGVGGYGTDQAFLRYRKLGKRYCPDIVLIGFMPVDLQRNVNVYRRFISTSEYVHFKPRFKLGDDGELVLIPLPINSLEDYWRYYENPELVEELGRFDYSYKPLVYENPLYDYSATVRLFSQAVEWGIRRTSSARRLYNGRQFNPESDAFKVTRKILNYFSAEVKKDGASPIVVMFPSYDSLSNDPSERVNDYQPLLNDLRDEGIGLVDLANAFNEPISKTTHYMPGGHYSPQSNRLIARYLARYLQEINIQRKLGRACN